MAKHRARGSKGRFVKGGGGGGSGGALVLVRSAPPARRRRASAPRKHRVTRRRRSSARGGAFSVAKLALAGAGLAALVHENSPLASKMPMVRDAIAKVPGAKTFGNTAVAGVACLAIDKWVKPNKWLRLAGYVGIASAAIKLGAENTGFKFVGDEDGDYIADVD